VGAFFCGGGAVRRACQMIKPSLFWYIDILKGIGGGELGRGTMSIAVQPRLIYYRKVLAHFWV